ncbi:MAG: methyltransferase [Proteobacteria bacterium]|nr:methyltransferase [Pseudomonadota bacterium]
MSVETAIFPVTEDTLLGGTLRLRQRAKGHRAGSDAVLLAAAAPQGAQTMADLGAASGAVGLMAALLRPHARVSLLEQEAALVALAQENIALNALQTRIEARAVDAFRLGGETDLREHFDAVLTNPPFFETGATRISPEPGRASAHHMTGDLHRWISGVLTLLKPKGELVMIHRADHLDAVLGACTGRFGAITLRFVHPRAGEPASRLLISGIKGSRAPLSVLPPLVLHEGEAFTPLADALHKGQAALSMRP